MKAQKNIQLAGLFFLGFDTYNVGSKVSPLELQVSPVAWAGNPTPSQMACVWSLVSIGLFCVIVWTNTELYIKVETQ